MGSGHKQCTFEAHVKNYINKLRRVKMPPTVHTVKQELDSSRNDRLQTVNITLGRDTDILMLHL